MINTALYSVLGTKVLYYLDDVLIFLPSLEQHIEDVREVLGLLKKNELFVKFKTCELFKNGCPITTFLVNFKTGNTIGPRTNKSYMH